ncbi:hypothetical protein Egran_00356, partial [Elaphomyces granulatus]
PPPPPPPPPPPLPPPIPLAYQNELQQGPQVWQPISFPPYSDYPPTHHYDPSVPSQGQPSTPGSHDSVMSTNYGTANVVSAPDTNPDQRHRTSTMTERPFPPGGPAPGAAGTTVDYASLQPPPTLPPKTGYHSLAPSASALGPGGPSDWEHFYFEPGGVDDTRMFQPKEPGFQPSSSGVQLLPCNVPMVNPTGPGSETVGVSSQGPEERSPSPLESRGDAPGRVATPVQPPRSDSLDSRPSPASVGGPSGSIDHVIRAWDRPISPETGAPNENYRHNSVSILGQTAATMEAPAERSMPEQVVEDTPQSALPKEGEVGIESVASTHPSPAKRLDTTPTPKPDGAASQPKAIDPYEDLDPWSKSSLTRFIAMLQKEASAKSNEERYEIFTEFMAKEMKLREILYNIEPQTKDKAPDTPPPSSNEPSMRSKWVGANPEIESGLSSVETDEKKGPQVLESNPLASNVPEDSENITYSPGGRPILAQQNTEPSRTNGQDLHRSTSNPSATSFGPGLAGNMAVRSGTNTRIPRSPSVPPAMMNSPLSPTLIPGGTTKPPEPTYTPFRYSEGPQRGSDDLVFETPAYQAYSALRQASVESGRVMSSHLTQSVGPRTGSLTPAPVRSEQDETFLGLIREKSVAYRRGKRPQADPPSLAVPEALKRNEPPHALEQLRNLIPVPFPGKSQNPTNAALRKEMESFSGDFRYIQGSVETWERSAEERRLRLDKERAARQEETEKHIDALYDDREIGYADIGSLEEESQQSEAQTQLEEERKELNSFLRNVFNPLDKRLKEEIVELKALYERAVDLLDSETKANKELQSSKYDLSHIMNTVNELYAKLEARYEKRLDISLDRERRRKRAERRPFVFLGDSRSLKQVDGDFDRMEKQNDLTAAKERDDRANRLMDFIDEAVMCGLGGHQRLVDDISGKTKKIQTTTIEKCDLPQAEIEGILRSTSALVKFLQEDSESMLHSFGIADSALNDADYSIPVAEARCSNSGTDMFQRLEEEKKKEVARMQQELDSKLNSVRKGPAEITAEIDTLLRSMGKALGPGSGPWGQPPIATAPSSYLPETLAVEPRPPSVRPGGGGDDDPEQKERLRKALEDAKRRNAAKQVPP